MAYEYRRNLNEFFGTLSAGCTALDTTLQSSAFQTPGIPSDYSTSLVTPMVLADDTVPTIEIIYVVGHTANTNTVTVVRGQEGTTARQWPPGTVIRCAPTVRDGIQSFSTTDIAALPNPHVGMEVVDTSVGRSKRKTKSQGFLSPAMAITQGKAYDGSTPPSDAAPITFSALVTGNTTGGPGVGSVVDVANSMRYVDVPQFPLKKLLSVTATRVMPGSAGTFAYIAFAGYEGGANPGDNLRLWFGCFTKDNVGVGLGVGCPFFVNVVGA